MNSIKPVSEFLAVVSKDMGNGQVLCNRGVSGLCGSCTEKKESCEAASTVGINNQKEEIPPFLVKNTYGALPGQVVRVTVPSRSIFISAVISYLIPLIFIFIGAFISMTIKISDGVVIIGASLGLLAGWGIAFILAKIFAENIWSPKMLGVLNVPMCNKNSK